MVVWTEFGPQPVIQCQVKVGAAKEKESRWAGEHERKKVGFQIKSSWKKTLRRGHLSRSLKWRGSYSDAPGRCAWAERGTRPWRGLETRWGLLSSEEQWAEQRAKRPMSTDTRQIAQPTLEFGLCFGLATGMLVSCFIWTLWPSV